MKNFIICGLLASQILSVTAQPKMETGGQNMPQEWIDKDTGHRIKKLIPRDGANFSFYFNNNPFVDNKMIFYGSNKPVNDQRKQEIYNIGSRQIFMIDLESSKVEQLTNESTPPTGEMVCAKTKEVFYQVSDTVYAINIETKEKREIFIFPKNFRGHVSTVNADGSLLAGTFTMPEDDEVLKSDANGKGPSTFTKIFEAKTPRIIFTIDTRTKDLDLIHADRAWLNHLLFSPTDPYLLMFCHEGTWHKVDRIWTIDVIKRGLPRLIHRRSIDREIAGHEWFAPDGRTIWYDLQRPRGELFYVAGLELATDRKFIYEVTRDEWSVHYTSSWDQKTFAGDGGSANSVAKSPYGHWLYLFRPNGNRLNSEKLVNMKNHDYKLEPNLHYSPDGKWLIFRANFEGSPNIYAVEIARTK